MIKYWGLLRARAPLVVLLCMFAYLAAVPLSTQPSPRQYPVLSTFPARYFPYCTSESFPDILVPGRGVDWNITVRPCGYNAVSVFGMKVTPFPGFEPSMRRVVSGSIGRIGLGDMNFTPDYAFFPQVLNGTSRQALFNATVTPSTPAGYYQHDTVFDYNGPDGVPREYNVTQTVKVSTIASPMSLKMTATLFGGFSFGVSLLDANGGPISNALIEACTLRTAYSSTVTTYLGSVDSQPTDIQGNAEFPMDEFKGLSQIVVMYSLARTPCGGDVGQTSTYIGRSVTIPPEPLAVPAYFGTAASIIVPFYAVEIIGVGLFNVRKKALGYNELARISLTEPSKLLVFSGGVAGLIISLAANPFPLSTTCPSCYPVPFASAVAGALLSISSGLLIQLRGYLRSIGIARIKITETIGGALAVIAGLTPIWGSLWFVDPLGPYWGWLLSWVMVVIIGGILGPRALIRFALRKWGLRLPFYLGGIGGFLALGEFWSLIIGSGITSAGGHYSPPIPFQGLFVLSVLGSSIASLLAALITRKAVRLGCIVLLLLGNFALTVAVLFAVNQPGSQLPSKGLQSLIFWLESETWAFLLITGGFIGLASNQQTISRRVSKPNAV